MEVTREFGLSLIGIIKDISKFELENGNQTLLG